MKQERGGQKGEIGAPGPQGMAGKMGTQVTVHFLTTVMLCVVFVSSCDYVMFSSSGVGKWNWRKTRSNIEEPKLVPSHLETYPGPCFIYTGIWTSHL